MAGEKNLETLLRSMKPVLNTGEYVFCTINDENHIAFNDIVFSFKETEGITVVTTKETADKLQLGYSFVARWITLTVHSSLEAVGLTAAFSNALAGANISCNVVAAYFHDHIFVPKPDALKAMQILNELGR